VLKNHFGAPIPTFFTKSREKLNFRPLSSSPVNAGCFRYQVTGIIHRNQFYSSVLNSHSIVMAITPDIRRQRTFPCSFTLTWRAPYTRFRMRNCKDEIFTKAE